MSSTYKIIIIMSSDEIRIKMQLSATMIIKFIFLITHLNFSFHFRVDCLRLYKFFCNNNILFLTLITNK